MRNFFFMVILVLFLGALGLAGFLLYSPGQGFIFDVDRAVGRLSVIIEFDPTESGIDSSEILTLFRSISTITLNNDVLLDPSFSRLNDITVPVIVDVLPGRQNPFLPIGYDVEEVLVEDLVVEEVDDITDLFDIDSVIN